MKGRKIIMAFVGTTQEAIGALTIVFSYILARERDVQVWLNIAEDHVPFYLVLLFVFGSVSIISGFFLFCELLQGQ
jgi:hypothetical protein